MNAPSDRPGRDLFNRRRALGVLGTAGVVAGCRSPVGLYLAAIYQPYVGPGAPGRAYGSRALAGFFYSPDTVALFEAAEPHTAPWPGLPDFDPFVGAGIWDLSEPPTIEVRAGARKGELVAVVSFLDAGRPRLVLHDLVGLGRGNRIHDTRWPGATSAPSSLRAALVA